MSDLYTNHPMTSPTHYCKDCGALWRQNDDFSMSLRWANACEACNNTPVGGQLFPLTEIPLLELAERTANMLRGMTLDPAIGSRCRAA